MRGQVPQQGQESGPVRDREACGTGTVWELLHPGIEGRALTGPPGRRYPAGAAGRGRGSHFPPPAPTWAKPA